jgi:DNA-nicking Smr family endonuclease
MKPPKSDGLNRPFGALEDLLRTAPMRTPSGRPHPATPPMPPAPPDDEDALFREAMAGVRRMQWNAPEDDGLRTAPPRKPAFPEDPALEHLRRLVTSGEGFSVAHTPEYMEGVGCLAPPEITRRLHRGDFAVQAHLDLHGFSAAAAREAFDEFMKEALAAGKRAVLIIHGRGLSSPAHPVLKSQLAKWLTSGTWRKWIVAFASARLCDGGSGASYVLLRDRPVPKRWRRRPQRQRAAGSV